MPKVPAYTLACSPATEAYELYETRDRGVLPIVPDSPAWFAWLDQVSSFAFVGKSADLSLARLEYIAGILHAQIAAQNPPAASLPTASTDGEMETAQPPLPARQRTPLHPLLATKLHVPRPHLVPRAR
jgi:hypothetical protein